MKYGSIITGIIADGLVLNMDAANRASYPETGTTATDTVNSMVGTLNGATFNNSNLGAWNFDGTDDYINIPDNNTLDFTSKMSGEIWLNFTSLGTNDLLLWKTNSYGIAYNATFTGNDANRLGVAVRSSGWKGAQFDQAISTGTWYCLSFTFNTPNLKCYLNGVLGETNTGASGGIATTSNPLRVGIDVGGSSVYAFQGLIGNVHLYNRELSANEVLHNYNALKGRFGL